MARSRSALNLSGTLLGVTFVHSKKYGNYVRAPRGTYKPAVLNKTCKKMNRHLMQANKPAKVIKDALDPFRSDFYCGSLWQRLQSLFILQHKNDGKFNLQALEGFEVFKDYPLRRFFNLQVGIARQSTMLKVTLAYPRHPRFRSLKFIDAYRLQVICIFPNLSKESAAVEVASSPKILLKSKVRKLSFEVPVPWRAANYLICVRLDGMSKNAVMRGFHAKGMQIVKAGRIL